MSMSASFFHTATVARVVNSISGGDVSSAISWFEDVRGPLSASERGAVRSACAKWGVDPARFGAPLPPPPGPETWCLRAHLTLDAIPVIATSNDFQAAMMLAAAHPESGRHLWRAEAVRYRQNNPGAPLDVEAITAAALNLRALFRRRAAA